MARDTDGHARGLRLYNDFAHWYPLLTPVGDYVEEAAFHRRLFEDHCHRPPRTLLDLGGLFSRSVWLELIAAAGFEPLAVPFEHSPCSDTGHEVFLGTRPSVGREAQNPSRCGPTRLLVE